MKRVLVAPLNWGLGHATRSIPIIRHLIAIGHHVHLASDGRAGDLLRQEFPDLPFFDLPSYRIKHPKQASLTHWLKLLPGLQNAIREEQRATQTIVREFHLDVIISDNRYGVYHADARSAIMTHQLKIPHPLISAASGLVLKKLIDRFDVCWIPDYAPPKSLTARLSDGNLGIPHQYLGMLSRFSRREETIKYTALALISGPEPSRSHFEKCVLEQLQKLPGKKVLIQGKTDAPKATTRQGNITIYAYKLTEELEQMIAQSEFVIARAGYSSIMDMEAMSKPAVLVATPGQPEQLHLAARLSANPQFHIQTEHTLNLTAARRRFMEWSGSPDSPSCSWRKEIIGQFMD